MAPGHAVTKTNEDRPWDRPYGRISSDRSGGDGDTVGCSVDPFEWRPLITKTCAPVSQVAPRRQQAEEQSFPHQPAVRGSSRFDIRGNGSIAIGGGGPPNGSLRRCRNSNKSRHGPTTQHAVSVPVWRAHIRFVIDTERPTKKASRRPHPSGRAGICFDGVDVESNNTLLLYHPKQWRRLRRR
jgi:hypothetical protein